MDLTAFRASTTAAEPPDGLPLTLQALWWDAKGNWTRAHECAQAADDPAGARVHAYLHRVEGDLSNAGYWYRRAGTAAATGALADEWLRLAETFLAA